MAITVKLGSNRVVIEAPEGKKLKDIMIEVQKDYDVSSEAVATLDGKRLTEDDVVEDNKRVVVSTPSGEKG